MRCTGLQPFNSTSLQAESSIETAFRQFLFEEPKPRYQSAIWDLSSKILRIATLLYNSFPSIRTVNFLANLVELIALSRRDP